MPELKVPAPEREEVAPLQKLWLLMLTRNLWLIAAAVGVSEMPIVTVAFGAMLPIAQLMSGTATV